MNGSASSIAIVGTGLVSPLGVDLPTTWNAILAGESIRAHSPAALSPEVGTDRICQLSVKAAAEAMRNAGWDTADEIALVVGTSKGPVERWLTAPPVDLKLSGLGESARGIAEALRLPPGPRLTISAACASGLHALIRAAMLLERGEASRAMVIGVESSLHPLFVGCFQRLGVLPSPGDVCRPFDERRSGFLLSEAAAAVCLERLPVGQASLKLAGCGLGGAAGHLTAGDADGKTLRSLLTKVVGERPVDLVHAHGTGTLGHDLIELSAIQDLIRGEPAIYSHKAALGHSLGAAGLVATVLSAVMHQPVDSCDLPGNSKNCGKTGIEPELNITLIIGRGGGVVPGNVNTFRPLHAQVRREPVVRAVKRSIVMAAGFGGPTGVICLES